MYGRNVGDKTQCVVAHSDYTVRTAVSGLGEGNQTAPLAIHVKSLMESYKGCARAILKLCGCPKVQVA